MDSVFTLMLIIVYISATVVVIMYNSSRHVYLHQIIYMKLTYILIRKSAIYIY